MILSLLFFTAIQVNMPRTSDYVKRRVIALYKQGLNYSKIARKLSEDEGITIYRCTVAKLAKKFTRYGTLADKPNPGVKRLEFATKCAENNEQFQNVIFTDESSIWLNRHSKLCFRETGQPKKMKPTPKHPYKDHVWAGISTKGATPILIFGGLDRFFYVEEILQNTQLPFVKDTFQTFPDNSYRFQQDNDPKHTSK